MRESHTRLCLSKLVNLLTCALFHSFHITRSSLITLSHLSAPAFWNRLLSINVTFAHQVSPSRNYGSPIQLTHLSFFFIVLSSLYSPIGYLRTDISGIKLDTKLRCFMPYCATIHPTDISGIEKASLFHAVLRYNSPLFYSCHFLYF